MQYMYVILLRCLELDANALPVKYHKEHRMTAD